MGFIQNFSELATTPEREKALEIVEAGLFAIQSENVLKNNFYTEGDTLHIKDQVIDLKTFERVYVIGFGKGSAAVSLLVEKTLGERLTDGYAIDTVEKQFSKIHFTKGTHPLPSEQNIAFTRQVLEKIHDLTPKDLVIVVICGGGSALFEAPHSFSLERLTPVFDALLKSGATISEMNTVRKRLSRVKGGRLAEHLYPSRVVSLIFSDVPGNDLTVIASGPTVKDSTTRKDVIQILSKFNLLNTGLLSENDFEESVTDDKYFENVTNVVMTSNMTALTAMEDKARSLGLAPTIYSDKIQGDAHTLGKELIEKTKKGEALLVGGETTLKVKGTGKGGRNQTLVLSTLDILENDTIIVSIDSDGIDFFHFAGAVGDIHTREKAQMLGLDTHEYLENDDSCSFFEEVGDGIFTDRLESNVADLILVIKNP